MPAHTSFVSGAALFVFDESLRIVSWNESSEQLTGILAAEAVGRPCWEVIAGKDDNGGLACHRECSRARLVREGRSVPAASLWARTRAGRRRVAVETIAVRGDRPVFVHLMREAPAPVPPRSVPPGPMPRLTPRQREVLGLLSDGQSVKMVAQRLGLMETTVRNHIRMLFVSLGVHSQLEAVARARAYKLLDQC